jgi:hypothetical protein
VRLRTDNTTQKSGVISQGDRIEANVNEHNLALSIRSAHGKEAGHGNDLTLPARPAQWDAGTNPFQPEAAGGHAILRSPSLVRETSVMSMSVKETP